MTQLQIDLEGRPSWPCTTDPRRDKTGSRRFVGEDRRLSRTGTAGQPGSAYPPRRGGAVAFRRPGSSKRCLLLPLEFRGTATRRDDPSTATPSFFFSTRRPAGRRHRPLASNMPASVVPTTTHRLRAVREPPASSRPDGPTAASIDERAARRAGRPRRFGGLSGQNSNDLPTGGSSSPWMAEATTPLPLSEGNSLPFAWCGGYRNAGSPAQGPGPSKKTVRLRGSTGRCDSVGLQTRRGATVSSCELEGPVGIDRDTDPAGSFPRATE